MTFNHKVILKTISVVLIFEGIAMFVAGASGIFFNEKTAAVSLIAVAAFCILLGISTFATLRYDTMEIKTREGFFVTITVWLTVCIIGALPFMLSGFSFTESIFESTAGWTTTGAWVTNPLTLPNSLLLWKAICSWTGAIGILLFTVSVFPVLGVQGQKMARAEIPGPALEKMSAKMSDTAKLFYKIYILMTILEMLLLLPSKLPFFEILINTLFSVSTSGIVNFGGAGGGIIYNFTPYVKGIVTLFTFLSSCNFTVFFLISIGQWKKALKSVELRTYVGLLLGGTAIITIMLMVSGQYSSFFTAFGDSLTQAVSYGSTSGFKIADTNNWPSACKTVLLLLALIGSCSMSTGGSLKVIRFVIFCKLILRGGYKRIHPKAVKPIMLEGKPLSAKSASLTTGFVLMFFVLFIVSSLAFGLENFDVETTLSAAFGALTNNGTSFGLLADGDYSIFSAGGKLLSSVLMLCGRLEILPIIILFSRSFWNSDRARQ